MKTSRLELRISQEEKDRWSDQARRSGMPLAEWIRLSLNFFTKPVGTKKKSHARIILERLSNQPKQPRICRKNNPRCLRIGQCTCKAAPDS